LIEPEPLRHYECLLQHLGLYVDPVLDEQPLQLVDLVHVRGFHLFIGRALDLPQTAPLVVVLWPFIQNPWGHRGVAVLTEYTVIDSPLIVIWLWLLGCHGGWRVD